MSFIAEGLNQNTHHWYPIRVQSGVPRFATELEAQTFATSKVMRETRKADRITDTRVTEHAGPANAVWKGEGWMYGRFAWMRPKPAYENDSLAARRCDYCRAWYRGPALYCSLECARPRKNNPRSP